MNNKRVTKTQGHQDTLLEVASYRPKTCDLRLVTHKRVMVTLLIFSLMFLILFITTPVATYYLDAVNGDGKVDEENVKLIVKLY